jgi:hypothetical protein
MPALHHLNHSPTPTARRRGPRPEALLGEDHPLCRTERDIRAVLHQIAATMLFIGACILVPRPDSARYLVGAGVLVGFVLAFRLLFTVEMLQWWSFVAILDGLEQLPMRPVTRLRRHLLEPRRRRRVADNMERVLASARGAHVRGVPAMPRRTEAVLATERELTEVIATLRGGSIASARAVALCERLLSDGALSLQSRPDADTLRRELGRIRFLLAASP